MEGFAELFTRWADFVEVKAFLLQHANAVLPSGTRYEVRYDPDRLAMYGKVLELSVLHGEEFDQQQEWACEEPVAPEFPTASPGTYLVQRGVLPAKVLLPYPEEVMLGRRRVRYDVIKSLMNAVDAAMMEKRDEWPP